MTGIVKTGPVNAKNFEPETYRICAGKTGTGKKGTGKIENGKAGPVNAKYRF